MNRIDVKNNGRSGYGWKRRESMSSVYEWEMTESMSLVMNERGEKACQWL